MTAPKGPIKENTKISQVMLAGPMEIEPMTFSLEVSKIDGKNFDLGQYWYNTLLSACKVFW
jgi:hypothetical protein